MKPVDLNFEIKAHKSFFEPRFEMVRRFVYVELAGSKRIQGKEILNQLIPSSTLVYWTNKRTYNHEPALFMFVLCLVTYYKGSSFNGSRFEEP